MQVLLDEDRYLRVARIAARRGVSVAAVIRGADDQLPTDTEQRRTAIAAILAAEPMPVPAEPATLRREREAPHHR